MLDKHAPGSVPPCCTRATGIALARFNTRFPADNEMAPSVNQNVFFACWVMGVTWALWNFFFGSKMANFFRDKCAFAHATHVLCRRKTAKIIMSNPGLWVRLSRKLARRCGLGGGGGDVEWYEETVVTEINAMSQVPTFVFMCAQFTFQADQAGQFNHGRTAGAGAGAGSFVPAKFTMSPEYLVLRTHAGLNTNEQQKRLALLGPNDIPYKLNTWAELIAAEFASYLYLYQVSRGRGWKRGGGARYGWGRGGVP